MDQKHKNFGKVPKYLHKYQEEAKDLARKREELRAKRALPAGMRQINEEERIRTLEELQSTKRELNSMLQSLPISLRSDNLKARKRELEERCEQIEKAIGTFTRKIVYVKND